MMRGLRKVVDTGNRLISRVPPHVSIKPVRAGGVPAVVAELLEAQERLRQDPEVGPTLFEYFEVEAEHIRELDPGEIVIINEEGVRSINPHTDTRHTLCIFEFIYFARPDSSINGHNVYLTRKAHGRRLAMEAPVAAVVRKVAWEGELMDDVARIVDDARDLGVDRLQSLLAVGRVTPVLATQEDLLAAVGESTSRPAFQREMGATEILDVAVVADFEFTDEFGSDTTAEILTRMNIADEIFSQQLGIQLTVPQRLIVRDGPEGGEL